MGWHAARGTEVRARAIAVVVCGIALVATACGQSPPVSPLPSAASTSPSAAASSTATPPATPQPTAAPTPSPTPAPTPALPEDWHYEIVCNEADVACQLHLYDEHGRDRPGWPVSVAGQCFSFSYNLAASRDGVAYVACTTGSPRDVIHAFDPTGVERPGWPVKLAGRLVGLSWNNFNPCGSGDLPSLQEGPDRTVYVATARPADRTGFSLEAYAADGRPRPGWPRHFAKAEVPGFTVGLGGAVYAWWFEGVVGGEVLV